MLFAAVVRQAEDSRAVVYADTSQRTQSDERTVVLTAVIVGTLHKCALRKDVAHLQIRAHRRMQVTEHGAADCFIIILFHCILYFISLHLVFSNSSSLITYNSSLKYVSISLSPRPDTVSTTTSVGLNLIFSSAPSAWALSNAGMMPSSRVSS